VLDILLAVSPDLIFAVDKGGNTVLHWAVAYNRELDTITKLLKLHPEALRAKNEGLETPFHVAVRNGYDNVVKLLQWNLNFDEIVSVGVLA